MTGGGEPTPPGALNVGRSYATAVVSVAATLWLLSMAQGVLEPLVISVLVWFVLNALAGIFARTFRGHDAKPGLLARVLAALSVGLALFWLSVIGANSLTRLAERLPQYEANLKAMVSRATELIGFAGPMDLGALMERIEFTDLALGAAGTAVSFVSEVLLVLIYVLFLFAEAPAFAAKLRAIAPEEPRFGAMMGTWRRIQKEIEVYLGVKCIVGLAQAAPTFLVLFLLGIDGAAFWSVVIFVASFIPTIGTLIGIVFPSLIALVQFPTVSPFLITAGLLAAIQILGSNYLEPRMMGSSMNLSPLAILVAIFAGGALWGITGALVAVPALAIAVIAFAQVQSLRPVAILLSSDGRV